MVRNAISKGRESGIEIQAWGSDMVRLPSGRIMSAADALNWGIRAEAR